jgi:hypothetical protein
VLIQPLVYPHPDWLVWVSTYGGGLPSGAEWVVSPAFLYWHEQATSLDVMVAYTVQPRTPR